ncbi:uncharacterized protein LOC135137803 isoform X2 [Zophobas morio]|uniref:uncharacterized protein LOC135137803 isoform X2 n=1 Tax=Zophobas morio TaxID=2755281 RepID=UPI003083BE77
MSKFNHFFVFVLTAVFTKNATAAKAVSYYCEFGTCETEQYCCGDNKCCDKLLDLWYFWLGLGIVIVVVAVIIFLKYFLRKRKPQNYRFGYFSPSRWRSN